MEELPAYVREYLQALKTEIKGLTMTLNRMAKPVNTEGWKYGIQEIVQHRHTRRTYQIMAINLRLEEGWLEAYGYAAIEADKFEMIVLSKREMENGRFISLSKGEV